MALTCSVPKVSGIGPRTSIIRGLGTCRRINTDCFFYWLTDWDGLTKMDGNKYIHFTNKLTACMWFENNAFYWSKTYLWLCQHYFYSFLTVVNHKVIMETRSTMINDSQLFNVSTTCPVKWSNHRFFAHWAGWSQIAVARPVTKLYIRVPIWFYVIPAFETAVSTRSRVRCHCEMDIESQNSPLKRQIPNLVQCTRCQK